MCGQLNTRMQCNCQCTEGGGTWQGSLQQLSPLLRWPSVYDDQCTMNYHLLWMMCDTTTQMVLLCCCGFCPWRERVSD